MSEWMRNRLSNIDHLLSIATIHLPPTARINSLSKHFFEKLIRYYQEEHNLMSEWMRNTKIESCAPNSTTFEKKFADSLSQHFIEKLIRYYQEEHHLMSEWMRNTKIDCWATLQETICFLSPPSIWPPTVLPSRINSLSQHFFEKLIRYYQEEHNLMSEWMRNTKIESCATMQQTIYFLSPPSILPPTVLPLRKNSLSQHFIEKLIRYYQEEHHLMSEWMRNTKIDCWATLQETICFLSPPSIWPPTVLPSRKNSLIQHFFEKLIRYYQEEHNLMSEWMRNTKIESCATMQQTIYFLSPPSIWPPTVLPSRKDSLSQHFFEKLLRYYQEEHNLMSEWMRNTKIESWATMQEPIYFLSPPSILPPTVLPSRINSLSQHFFEKLIRYYQEEHNLMSEWMRNTKIESCATMQQTIYFLSPPSILPPTVLPSRKDSLSQHFFEKLLRYYQEEHNLMSEWMRNTKIESWATMQEPIYFLSPPSIWPPTVLPSRINSLSQHFFEKLIRYYQEEHNLMSEWMRNTKIESCATMQQTIYFLSPPSILPPTVLPLRKNSLSQHFIEKLIRYYQEEHHLMSEWMRNTKIDCWATLQETICFLSPPSIWPPTVLPSRINSLSQHFFEKLIRYYQEEHNLMSEWMRNTKIESCATMQQTIYFLSPPSILPPTVLPLRKNSLSQHFIEKLIRYYQEEHPYERMNEKH